MLTSCAARVWAKLRILRMPTRHGVNQNEACESGCIEGLVCWPRGLRDNLVVAPSAPSLDVLRVQAKHHPIGRLRMVLLLSRGPVGQIPRGAAILVAPITRAVARVD
eukprot:6168858-Pleurochrysis_carterae.AAC.1